MVNTRKHCYPLAEKDAHSEEPAVKSPKAALEKLESRKRGNGQASSEEPIQKRTRQSNDSGYGSSTEAENISSTTTRKILRAKRRNSEIGTTQQTSSNQTPKKTVKIIRANRFLNARIRAGFRKMVKRSCQTADVCEECKGENRCVKGLECLNREEKKECPRACKEAGGCNNRFITEKRGLKIKKDMKLFKTPKKGYGIKSKVFIPKGTYIGECVGEIIDREEKEARCAQKESKHAAFYLMAIDKYFIDGEYYSNYLRYINHSCDPNCHIQKYLSADGTPHMCLFALKDIAADVELTYRYSDDHSKNEIEHNCYCEAKHCNGKFKA